MLNIKEIALTTFTQFGRKANAAKAPQTSHEKRKRGSISFLRVKPIKIEPGLTAMAENVGLLLSFF